MAAAEPREGPSSASTLAVPRVWLVAVTISVIVPWLLVGAIYFSDAHDSEAEVAASAGAGSPAAAPPGPWGRLLLTPVVISPPAEYVPKNWGPLEPTLWHIPVSSPDELVRFLSAAGLNADQVARLQLTARPHPQAGGAVVSPGAELVRSLAPDVRARLYTALGRSELNIDQQTAYRFYGASPDGWLSPPISAGTRQLIEPFIYRHGDFMYFADIEAVRSQIDNEQELQLLAKQLLKQSTMLVHLQVDRVADVPAIAEYWGRGGRRTDIRPLLESVAGGGPARTIDIGHLLPTLAREHLYRYPRVTVSDHEKPLLANCLWTALNFFRSEPDDRFLDVRAALDTLKTDYYLVHDRYQLGDVVAFSDREGNLFHAAVYLADDLVFGKNGNSPLAPWSILPLARLKGHYVEYGDEWQVSYHRHKEL